MGQGIVERRIFFLVNPQAGGGRARCWWEEQLPLLEAANIDFFWDYTASPHSAAAQLRDAVCRQQAAAVMIVGGDGSLYDAVNGLIEDGHLLKEDLVLGLCPLGSGCDFSRFAYGARPYSLLALLQRGRIAAIDVGSCAYHTANGSQLRYYINSFDIGAGADTCLAVNAHDGRLKHICKNGKLAFLLAALKVLLGFSYTPTEIIADGQTLQSRYIIAGVGNGRFAGGGMMLFPNARLNDGLLDVMTVRKMSKARMLLAFPKIYSGRHLSFPQVEYLQAAHVSIRTQRPLPFEADGEIPGTTDVELAVLPGLLNLLIPEDEH